MNKIPAFQDERDYIVLLRTLITIAEANKGDTVDDRLLNAEGLLKKCLGHASSALYLYRITTLPDVEVTAEGISFFDAASINVLGRAALEAFLVFHYVYVSPKSDDEKDFRYYSYCLASLLDKQKFPVQTDTKVIEELKGKLKNNDSFNKLTVNQKQNLLEKGRIITDWKHQSWKDISIDAGLSEILADQFYSYLCGYAHSGCQSVQQIGNAEDAVTQKALCVATMQFIMIAMANMICSYGELFGKSKAVLENDKDALSIVNRWIECGASLQNEFIGTRPTPPSGTPL